MKAKTAGSCTLLHIQALVIIQLFSQSTIVWGKEDGLHKTECDPCISDKNCRRIIEDVLADIKEGSLDVASKKLKNRPKTAANVGIWKITELFVQCLEGKADVSIFDYVSAKYGNWQASYASCHKEEIETLPLMTHNALLQCYAERLHELLGKQQFDAVQTANTPLSSANPAPQAPSAQKPRLPGWARVGIGIGTGLLLSGAVIGGVLGWSDSRWTSASQAR